MKWQLAGDWPAGPAVIPAGTILDSEARSWPMPPPLDAVALDVESALFMLKEYDPDLWHRIIFARDIDRAAVLAEAASRRRWPNGPPQSMSGPSPSSPHPLPPPQQERSAQQRKDLEMPKYKPRKPRPVRKPEPAKKPVRKPDHGDS